MNPDEKTERKNALKKLREERKATIERVRARSSEVNEAMKKIRVELGRGPRTIPDLARAVGLPTEETLWYVMALKKYGKVAEGAKSRGESYYPYEWIQEAAENKAAE